MNQNLTNELTWNFDKEDLHLGYLVWMAGHSFLGVLDTFHQVDGRSIMSAKELGFSQWRAVVGREPIVYLKSNNSFPQIYHGRSGRLMFGE